MKKTYYIISVLILALLAIGFFFETSEQTDLVIKIIIAVLAFVFPVLHSVNTSQPLKVLINKSRRIIDGELNIKQSRLDDKQGLGIIDKALSKLTGNINKSIDFIEDLENGNLEVEYQQDEGDKNNTLGESLISLRDKLKEIAEQEKVRNWTTEGLAKFVEILRSTGNDNLSTLSDRILNNLVKYLHANQGQLFILNEEQEEKYLDMISFYAFTRKKHEKINLDSDEGLIGQAYKEKETIYLTEVPDDFVKVTSGLGEANPKCVLIVPLKVNDNVFGIIELASFEEFKPYEISFVEKLGESIASTISTTKLNDRTKKLLEESQQASEELRAQEEEMRQNMEELQATQEEVQRQMKENEKMQENLTKEKALLDSLLDTVPDLIYFKDRDSKFIRMSKSMIKLFPVKSIEEMIGKSDFDFHREEAAQEYFDEEQEIIKTKKGFVDKIHHEKMDNGLEQWVSTTKLPLMDKNNKCIGTFGITKDITNLKLAQLDAEQKSEELAAQEQVFIDNMEELKILRKKLSEMEKEKQS